MRRLAYPATVESLSPVPDADRLEVARMRGSAWQVVVGKGEFHPGQRVVYFEIDSALPADDERYVFLLQRCLKQWKLNGEVLDQCVRIRTMKLRGVLSQGLVMPFSAFPEIGDAADGDDVTAALKVRHYDELAAAMQAIIAPGMGNLQQKGPFPSCVPKTDEERIQNLPDWPLELRNVIWEVSTKVDGASSTMAWAYEYRPEDPFFLCSRNFELNPEADNAYAEMARKFSVREKLERLGRNGTQLAIQGEIVGPGMNGNRDRLKERDFLVFRIWDIGKQEFLTAADRRRLCAELGLHHVPVLDSAATLAELGSVDEILRYAEGLTANGNEREGVVFKEVGTTHPRSFKAVSNRYLLKEK